MRSIKHNKKGSLEDLPYILTVIFFFAVVVLIGVYFLGKLNTQIQASSGFNPDSKALVSNIDHKVATTQNNIFIFFAVTIGMVAIILASTVRIHPIFLLFFILGLIVLLIVVGALSQGYQQLTAGPLGDGDGAGRLPFIVAIMNHLPLLIAVIATFMMIIMYRNWSGNI
jgi:hypothetical protein